GRGRRFRLGHADFDLILGEVLADPGGGDRGGRITLPGEEQGVRIAVGDARLVLVIEGFGEGLVLRREQATGGKGGKTGKRAVQEAASVDLDGEIIAAEASAKLSGQGVEARREGQRGVSFHGRAWLRTSRILKVFPGKEKPESSPSGGSWALLWRKRPREMAQRLPSGQCLSPCPR